MQMKHENAYKFIPTAHMGHDNKEKQKSMYVVLYMRSNQSSKNFGKSIFANWKQIPERSFKCTVHTKHRKHLHDS